VSLFPRTLFGRNVLLMIALIALAEGASAIIYRQYVQKPRIVQLAALTALYVDAVRASLSSASPAERAAFRDALNASERVRLVAVTDALPPFAAPRSPAARLYFSELAQRLAAGAASRRDEPRWQARPEPALWIRLGAVPEPQWLVISGDRLDVELPWVGLEWSLLVAGIALAGALVIQRRLNRPLTDLARAAEQVGRGEAPPPLPETGPAEIAAVARSFNRMSTSLERTERERAIMLAGVSHELRTPLTKLRLAATMLEDGTNPELHESMKRNIEAIDATVGQFLDFARAGDGEKPEIGDFAALVASVIAEFAAQGHPIAQEPGTLPRFAFRPAAMRRLVVNLVDNAVRHAGEGIAVHCGRQGETIHLSVLDRGPGIPPARAEAMKQPFARLERDVGKPGAGLGLAIVDRIARMHGGELQLLARGGGGLAARVSLPL
jgi:two-component system osmolarity sensor histidine kinase EnvZ